MSYMHGGKKYSSKKHPMLEHIFFSKNPNGNTNEERIQFTLKDISNGYKACNIPEPASISNTILDLTRKRRPINSRLPESIYSLGYDLRKKTGDAGHGVNFAGEFVYVGIGNEIESWLSWPNSFPAKDRIVIDSSGIPNEIRKYIRNDEGALFSVIDYCDALSKVLGFKSNSVIRIQNPLKWQPNEVDGFYFGRIDGREVLYPVEAKALTTGDDINLEQMGGAMKMMCDRYSQFGVQIQPLAVKMVKNGIHLAIFNRLESGLTDNELICERRIEITLSPVIESW